MFSFRFLTNVFDLQASQNPKIFRALRAGRSCTACNTFHFASGSQFNSGAVAGCPYKVTNGDRGHNANEVAGGLRGPSTRRAPPHGHAASVTVHHAKLEGRVEQGEAEVSLEIAGVRSSRIWSSSICTCGSFGGFEPAASRQLISAVASGSQRGTSRANHR